MKKRCKKCAKHDKYYRKAIKKQALRLDALLSWFDDDRVLEALEQAVEGDEMAMTTVRDMREADTELRRRGDEWFYGHLKNERPA